ncbi:MULTISPECIES: M48 family metalloprotease [Rosistilla]|uniref:TPR repeat-containing protein YfgC n=2 Tax=Rosistilla TaxID=2795779 RepID=A0A518IMK1_9BACT|nr:MULTISPECIES: M48 family metalloprotease [Rosistilla]QDS85988.1 TPR repeat-containing protein YfgC precursor [Rosistilla ulvae]QDV54304.1 TPR repeat-containing protein YfgC precursor [Rosistilla oblonga]
MPFGFGRRSNSGLKLRLMIAAGLALFSFISYLSTGQRNPITGEKQRVAMSPDQEIALGLQAAPEMAAQHGGLHPDPQARAHVDQVGQRLLSGLDDYVRVKQGTNPFQFKFHLLKDPQTINAFALPGGQVFITAALYSRLQTEGQLAGVLGHEIGHVLSRHGAQRLAKQKLTSGLVGAAGVAGGDISSAQLAQAIGQMLNMKYGRDDELESDRWGVLLTAQAGYDPRAMLGVMQILDEASGSNGPPEMMSTHPKPANRQAYIQEVLRSVFPNGIPEGLDP